MNFVFVGAHPDDIEFGCAGTIKSLTKQGHKVLCVVMTDGDKGGDKMARIQEQENAAYVLGCELKLLHKPDLGVQSDDETVAELCQIIVSEIPTAVFVHTAKDKHPDHLATTKATEAAVNMASQFGVDCMMVYYKSYSSIGFFPIWTVNHGERGAKEKALLCHASQIEKYYGRGVDFIARSGLYEEQYEI